MGLPDDAVGIFAKSNDNPLEYRYTQNLYMQFGIVLKTQTQMVMRQKTVTTHNQNNYLGAIVSEDRSIVYWINDTKPIPVT